MGNDVGLTFWLTQWNWQPSIVLGTVVVIALYLYAVGPLREKYHLGPVVTTGQAVSFLLGVNIIFLALFSALDRLGDNYLFSAHMVQHLLLTIVAPPLMVIGTPAWLIQPLLRNRVIFRVGRFLTLPLVAFFLFNADFWIWHAPPLYDLTLYDETLHTLEHLTFIIFGVIYWWPVFSPLKEGWPRLSMGGQILYIFLGGMPSVALGAGLTFAKPLYTAYIYAPRVWGISAATDQQLGGLIMWVPANIAYIIVASFIFIRWMQAQDVAQRAADRRMYDEVGDDVIDEEDDNDLSGDIPPSITRVAKHSS